MDDLKKENRLLNRLQVRQEKALDHFQSREGDLPQILIRHEAEVCHLLYPSHFHRHMHGHVHGTLHLHWNISAIYLNVYPLTS